MKKETRMKVMLGTGLALMITVIGMVVLSTSSSIDPAEYKAKVEAAQMGMNKIARALSRYKLWCQVYPSNETGLLELEAPQDCKNTSAFIKPIPLDPWGQYYQYKKTEKGYELYSFGPDKESGGFGTNADIYYSPAKK